MEKNSEKLLTMIAACLSAVVATIGLFTGKLDSAAWGATIVAAIGSITYYAKTRKDKKVAEIEAGKK